MFPLSEQLPSLVLEVDCAESEQFAALERAGVYRYHFIDLGCSHIPVEGRPLMEMNGHDFASLAEAWMRLSINI